MLIMQGGGQWDRGPASEPACSHPVENTRARQRRCCIAHPGKSQGRKGRNKSRASFPELWASSPGWTLLCSQADCPVSPMTAICVPVLAHAKCQCPFLLSRRVSSLGRPNTLHPRAEHSLPVPLASTLLSPDIWPGLCVTLIGCLLRKEVSFTSLCPPVPGTKAFHWILWISIS